MAHLWMHSPQGWSVLPLTTEVFDLNARVLRSGRSSSSQILPRRVTLRRTLDNEAGERWLILAPPQTVWTNGRPLFPGARVLRDRDEIRLRGADPVYFSTERLAQVTPFPGADRPVHCARCRDVIEPETPSVQCPSCGMWHHQCVDRECWSYAPTCASCQQGTALDTGYQWTPGECLP